MRFFEKIQVIERIDQLIKMKATGSARDLARRTNLSKSTIYEILDIMKCMGAEIEYCTCRKSYYYVEDKTLAIGFVNKSKIYGGRSVVSSFLGQHVPTFTISCV
ncbi:MAG: hypothetical protein P1U56_02580 [Saprospiraceae bacterium]|nr:hypothetical protein [Saprospiraceae bacterium]